MKNDWPLQRDCIKFYGDPTRANWLSANTVRVPCPWALFVGKVPVKAILIHKKCAESLTRVLAAVWAAVDKDEAKVKKLKYHIYDGSYNLRHMRGSNQMSMHSFACAIDWDAADNPFNSKKHLFQSDSLLIVKFKEESWIWGGDWGSPDAMHVQAARVR